VAAGAAAIASGASGPTLNYADPLLDGIPPSYQDASFNIQHSFSPNLTLSVGWAGSFGRHLAGAGVAGLSAVRSIGGAVGKFESQQRRG
jgi:hypothetical protein